MQNRLSFSANISHLRVHKISSQIFGTTELTFHYPAGRTPIPTCWGHLTAVPQIPLKINCQIIFKNLPKFCKNRFWTSKVQLSISSTLNVRVFHRYPFAKKSQSRTFQLLIFGAKILYEKHVHKTLMKLTAVVPNFL